MMLNSQMHESKEANCTPTAGVNCNSVLNSYIGYRFFFRPFSKILPSRLKRIIPPFISMLIMRKPLYLASEWTALLPLWARRKSRSGSCAGEVEEMEGKKRNAGWVGWKNSQSWWPIKNNHEQIKGRMQGWKTSICSGLDTWQERHLLENVLFNFQKPKW